MDCFINKSTRYRQGMQMVTTVQRPAVIMTPSKSTYVKLYGIMCSTVNTCMSKYKNNMNDLEYLFWMQLIIDVVRDEIDGYVKHHYSRVPSSSSRSFARFVENEFQILIAPICDKIVRKQINKEKRKAIIARCNEELSNNVHIDDERRHAVSFNMQANTLCVFDRDE